MWKISTKLWNIGRQKFYSLTSSVWRRLYPHFSKYQVKIQFTDNHVRQIPHDNWQTGWILAGAFTASAQYLSLAGLNHQFLPLCAISGINHSLPLLTMNILVTDKGLPILCSLKMRWEAKSLHQSHSEPPSLPLRLH